MNMLLWSDVCVIKVLPQCSLWLGTGFVSEPWLPILHSE